MEMYLRTDYEKETDPGTLRTDNTAKVIVHMDCSELVARYLKATGAFSSVIELTTVTMCDKEKFQKDNDGNILFVSNSDKKDFIPKRGDIFVFRGHTGIVIEYIEDGDKVRVLEALGNLGSSENSLPPDENRKVGQITESTYTRTGKALSSHSNWVGYYRPIIK